MLRAQTDTWYPQLEGNHISGSLNVAQAVATRLRDKELVKKAIALAATQTSYPRSIHWEPYGIAQGYAGLALMCSYLDMCFSDQEWDFTAHSYIETAIRAAEQQPYLPTGIFSGLSGIAFAVWSLSHDGRRYSKLLTSLEQILFPQVIAQAYRLRRQKNNIFVGQFDLISGLSGVGAYLMCRQHIPMARRALQEVLISLVSLTQEEQGLPRWYTPPHLIGDQKLVSYYPYGNLNCGLAHGSPAILGILALAQLSDIIVEGMEEAIHRVARWLLHHRMDDQWGINWPTAVRIEADRTTSLTRTVASPFEPSRTAWCYGSPGIARTLWLAGKALDTSEYCEQAIAAMDAVYRRPLQVRHIDSPTFCHGVAGLMQITLRFAQDTGLPQFKDAAQSLGEQLLSLYRPDRLLGYYSLEPDDNCVDQPGLLDGVPGVVLVLLAAATHTEPVWDRLFLLS